MTGLQTEAISKGAPMNRDNLFTTTLKINITKLPPKPTQQPARRAKRGQAKAAPAWPEKKMADAEMEFTEGILKGHTLRGFTVWRKDDGELFVTYPQRSYKSGDETKYYSFLFGKNEVVRDVVQSCFIAEYRRVIEERIELAEPPTDDPDDEVA
jgi:hypothetical protein